jgi:adenosylhomocysteine nucleosidase
MSRICIICAIHQESSPILRGFPRSRKSLVADIPAWEIESGDATVHLLQSGIGLDKAARTARIAADLLRPDVIMNAGFCGALFPGLAIGDALVAEKLYHYSSGIITHDTASDSTPPGPPILTGHPGIRPGTFISSEDIVDKLALISHIKHFATPSTVIEMESWGISEVCRKRGIKFAAIRTVSDSAESDPAELFRNICDHDFNISPAKLLLLLLRKPLMINHLFQLAKNARTAGRCLANAVHYTVEQMK